MNFDINRVDKIPETVVEAISIAVDKNGGIFIKGLAIEHESLEYCLKLLAYVTFQVVQIKAKIDNQKIKVVSNSLLDRVRHKLNALI